MLKSTVMQYVTEELRTYHDQITGVTNRNTMVLRLRNVKFFMSPTVAKSLLNEINFVHNYKRIFYIVLNIML